MTNELELMAMGAIPYPAKQPSLLKDVDVRYSADSGVVVVPSYADIEAERDELRAQVEAMQTENESARRTGAFWKDEKICADAVIDQLRVQVEAMRIAVSGYLQALDNGEGEYEVRRARHKMRRAVAAMQAKP